MKRFWSGVITATVVATVGLGAQAAPGAQSSPAAPSAQGGAASPQGAQPGSQAAGKVTVSGCIQNAPAASASAGAKPEGGAGAAASASAGTQDFVLADAKMATGSSSGAVGTSGTAATRYELDGDAKTISQHLNHQVEITGTVEGSSSSSGAAGAAGSRASSAPTLKVESVKMVSATCK